LRGALRAPLHAYLFIGPPGTGRRDASIAFAAALLCPSGGCGECTSCQEALALRHPDLAVIERAGASILVDQAREVARMALRTPRAARYQVLVLVDFDLVEKAAPALLKTIEEPPDTTVIVLIAETVPSQFVTIASRCVQVQFKPLDDEAIIEVLMREGVEVATATSVAEAAGGRLDRARLLARDPGFAERLQRWRSVPSRLDGTGATGRRAGLAPGGGRAAGRQDHRGTLRHRGPSQSRAATGAHRRVACGACCALLGVPGASRRDWGLPPSPQVRPRPDCGHRAG